MIVDYLTAKNGEQTIKINNYFLHSEYNPSKEAIEFAEKYFKEERLHLVYGFGAGHFIKALHKKAIHGEKIIVIEPYIEVSSDLNNVTIINANSENEIRKALEEQISVVDNVNIIISPNYDKIDSITLIQVLNAINKKLHSDFVAESTHNHFNKQWPKNYLLNLQYILKDESVINLVSKYTEPIVIASGGPSLTKQINTLKQIRNNIVLIAAGSTVNTLLNNDIEPDYIVSVDGTEANYNHFKNIQGCKSRLIYALYNHYLIRDIFEMNGYFFATNQDTLNHMQKYTDQKVLYLSGGTSVANYAYSLAILMTTGPIAIIGQDLAFTNNKTHADHNKNMKSLDDIKKCKDNFIEIDGYYGEKVLSDYVYLTMKESFETLHKSLGEERLVFNCTEGGAMIDGIENMTFKEFARQYATLPKQNIEIEKANCTVSKDEEKMILGLKNENEIFLELIKLFEKSLNLLESNKFTKFFSKEILMKLDCNDEKIQKLSEDTMLNMALQVINLNTLKYFKPQKNESTTDTYNRIYKQNKMLYEKMLEETIDTQKHLNTLIELLMREPSIK
ncbi:motility associated factor glycosyltransferase family protein [Lysinibacillus xylanilyticus]|uniref:motility associated factor glycosyltransferase family protein n=1 Tax=Lysinibacillus xylanilyticus TaxID=582475 RepID=UPI003D00A426